MRILFWTYSHLPDLGGFQWSTYRLAKSLKQLGHEPSFLTGTRQKANFDQLVPTVRIVCASVREWADKSGKWLLDNRNKFDVVHVIDLFYEAIDVQLKVMRASGLPTVLKIPTLGYVPRLIDSDALKQGLGSVDAIIALNDGIRSELTGIGIDNARIRHIPNGIDTHEFVPSSRKGELRKHLGVPQDRRLLLFVGRFVYRKRIDVLIEAASRLSHTAHLILVGSGNGQRDSVEEQVIRRATDTGNVTVYGPALYPLKYYQACDINLLLSEREGLPNTVLEGMSCSMPTVATSIAGIIGTINSGNEGILVPVGNITQTTEAINLLIGNRGLRDRMGKAARKRAKEEFDIRIVADKYIELYGEIIKGRKV